MLQEIFVREHMVSLAHLQGKTKKQVGEYLETIPAIVPCIAAATLALLSSRRAVQVDDLIAVAAQVRGRGRRVGDSPEKSRPTSSSRSRPVTRSTCSCICANGRIRPTRLARTRKSSRRTAAQGGGSKKPGRRSRDEEDGEKIINQTNHRDTETQRHRDTERQGDGDGIVQIESLLVAEYNFPGIWNLI